MLTLARRISVGLDPPEAIARGAFESRAIDTWQGGAKGWSYHSAHFTVPVLPANHGIEKLEISKAADLEVVAAQLS